MFNIYTQKQMDGMLLTPDEIKNTKEFGCTFAINRSFDERTIAYNDKDFPVYIGYKTYDWRSASNVVYITNKLEDKEALYKYLFERNRHSINKICLPIPILKELLYKKEKIDMSSFSVALSDQDINQIEYNKINKDSLASFSLCYVSRIIKSFNVTEQQCHEEVKDFIKHLCKLYTNGKSKSDDVCQMKDIIRNYILLYDTKEKQSEAAWFCIDAIESNFRKKDSIICRKMMTEIFTFVSWYTRKGERDNGLIDLVKERDGYLLNMYFKYKVNTWYCRSLIMDNINLIKDWDKVDISELLLYTNEKTKNEILSYVNGNKQIGDIDLLTNRIYANYGDELASMSIEMIYLTLSKFSVEEFNNMKIDHLAEAIVKKKLYMRVYARLMPQETFIKDKENIDRLTEVVVENISEKSNIKNSIKDIMNNSSECYFYQSLKKAVQNTNSKKIKKILLNLNI